VVRPDSDRVGARLDGAPLRRLRDDELPSEGLVTGAIQVPHDGRPIVMLADHPVTGGYPVVGIVEPADLPVVAQARPGTPLRFTSHRRG
jgi:allophanate hydrolase subunit 2